MAGWIKVWDVPDDHWLMSDARYYGLWVWLIRQAETKSRKIIKDGTMIETKRGTVYTSINEIAEKWSLTWRVVAKFLEMCEADGMIIVEHRKNRGTNIIISNYAKYQDSAKTDSRTKSRTDDRTEGRTASRTDGRTEATSFLTNTEGKDYTEGIEGEARFTPPTMREVEDYLSSSNLRIDAERFVNYYEARGWKDIRSWKAAARAWASRDKARSQPAAKKFDNFEPRPDGDLMDQYIKQLEERMNG